MFSLRIFRDEEITALSLIAIFNLNIKEIIQKLNKIFKQLD